MLNLSDYSSYHREEFITNLEEYGFHIIEDLVPLYFERALLFCFGIEKVVI